MEKDFLKEITEATGLPAHLITRQLESLAREHNLDLRKVSLEEFRQLMVKFLQKEILAAKKTY